MLLTTLLFICSNYNSFLIITTLLLCIWVDLSCFFIFYQCFQIWASQLMCECTSDPIKTISFFTQTPNFAVSQIGWTNVKRQTNEIRRDRRCSLIWISNYASIFVHDSFDLNICVYGDLFPTYSIPLNLFV